MGVCRARLATRSQQQARLCCLHRATGKEDGEKLKSNPTGDPKGAQGPAVAFNPSLIPMGDPFVSPGLSTQQVWVQESASHKPLGEAGGKDIKYR